MALWPIIIRFMHFFAGRWAHFPKLTQKKTLICLNLSTNNWSFFLRWLCIISNESKLLQIFLIFFFFYKKYIISNLNSHETKIISAQRCSKRIKNCLYQCCKLPLLYEIKLICTRQLYFMDFRIFYFTFLFSIIHFAKSCISTFQSTGLYIALSTLRIKMGLVYKCRIID